MTCFPPLSASVRPEPRRGDPVTAANPDKTVTDDYSSSLEPTREYVSRPPVPGG